MTTENQDEKNDLTTSDGRKIINFSAGGESYGVETTEQAAKGRKAEIEAEIEEMKLHALRYGIRRVKL
jgi:hypothetical protein